MDQISPVTIMEITHVTTVLIWSSGSYCYSGQLLNESPAGKKKEKKVMFAEQVIHAAIFFCACLICVPSLRDLDGPLLILITLTWSHDLASSSL
jgi:hypothetical protein